MTHHISAVFRLLFNVATRQSKLLFKWGLFSIIAFFLSNISLVNHANATTEEQLFLPLILNPAIPDPPPNYPVAIENSSFENGWTDLPPAPGYLINQQPKGWQLTWVEPGQNIFESNYVSRGVPECVHKLNAQLPPHEQAGGSDPLILDGNATYKIFHYAAAFGAELEQTISGLTPEHTYRVTVPLRIHGVDSDPWGAESGVWVDGVGSWVNQEVMGDRTWYYHTLDFTALPSGEAIITVRVKSKYNLSKDFFMDDLQLEVVSPQQTRVE